MAYFNSNGVCIPSSSSRTYKYNENQYYKFADFQVNYESIFNNLLKSRLISKLRNKDDFEKKATDILLKIGENPLYSNVLNGPKIPFIIEGFGNENDLGTELENELLPKIKDSFNSKYSECYFKAILQSDSELSSSVKITNNSNYEAFINKCQKDYVIGWYFPTAFMGYDIDSQITRFKELPEITDLNKCLSGGIEISSSLISIPELLINTSTYSPILCITAYQHVDPRLVLIFKSYGPHLEFWCMTQMLTKGITQVSEQWTGGLTIYN